MLFADGSRCFVPRALRLATGSTLCSSRLAPGIWLPFILHGVFCLIMDETAFCQAVGEAPSSLFCSETRICCFWLRNGIFYNMCIIEYGVLTGAVAFFLVCIKSIDLGIIRAYTRSTKIRTFFSTERSAGYVSCKEYGC